MNTRYKPGEKVVITEAGPLNGLRAEWLSQSSRTGATLVRLLEGRGAWRSGERVALGPGTYCRKAEYTAEIKETTGAPAPEAKA